MSEKPSPNFTWEEAIKLVREVTDDPNVKTTAEIAELWGMSTRQAERYLEDLRRRGLVEKILKKFEDITGRVQEAKGWRLLQDEGREAGEDQEN